MSDAAPVVWIDEAEAHEDAGRALAEWARARGVRLEVVEDRTPRRFEDPTVAGEGIERELERARLAIGVADADATERALARAEAILRAHPELPQAAWLRAEVERAWSARWLRLAPRDEARARIAWENAQALDGGRVAGVGETSFPPRRKTKASIVVVGGTRVSLRLDGAPITPISGAADLTYDVLVAEGEHQLVAALDGEVVFASWVTIAGLDPAPTRVTVTEGTACSREQLGRVQLEAHNNQMSVVAAGVSCPRWIAAAPGPKRGSVLVARCEHDVCGPLLEWRVELVPSETPRRRPQAATWPSWATWALVGIGAATVTSMAIIATGVLETRPVEPRFVVGGARQE